MRVIRIITHGISKLFFNIMALLLGIDILFLSFCADPAIVDLLSSNFLGSGRTEVIITGKEPVRFKSWYSSIDDVMRGNGAIAASAEAEGAVLLKNEGNALPLNAATDKVSLFGVVAYAPMYSLEGAGRVRIDNDKKQYFTTEFEKVGLQINKELSTWYNSNTSYFHEVTGNISNNTVMKGANWAEINTPAKTADGYNTAIFGILCFWRF